MLEIVERFIVKTEALVEVLRLFFLRIVFVVAVVWFFFATVWQVYP
jgi:hypothetical protein